MKDLIDLSTITAHKRAKAIADALDALDGSDLVDGACRLLRGNASDLAYFSGIRLTYLSEIRRARRKLSLSTRHAIYWGVLTGWNEPKIA